MSRFALLAARRSGTTLFLDILNKHPRVQCVKRAFGKEKRIRNPTPDNHSGRFFLYRTATLGRRVGFYLRRGATIGAFLADDIFRPEGEEDVLGFRLTYDQADEYPQVMAWLREHQAKVVHLVRENVLKTYLSEITAPLHKMHHPREGDEIKTVTIRVDPQSLLRTLDARAGRVERMRERLEGVPHLEVKYESLVANRAEELRRIFPFLGIHDPVDLKSDLVKINPDSIARLIENYEDVAAVLQGTEHERFLS